MNKKKLLSIIKDFILESSFALDHTLPALIIHYKDIKEFVLYNDDLHDYLELRKDKLLYIDHIIKCDKQFITDINDNIAYRYKRNRKGYIAVTPILYRDILSDAGDDIVTDDKSAIEASTDFKITKTKIKYSSTQIIQRLNLDGMEKYSCPYNKSIQEITHSKKNKFKLSLTNEPVLCTYLQSLRFIEEFEKDYFDSAVMRSIYCADRIDIYNKSYSSAVGSVSIGNSLMLVSITDPKLKSFCDRLNKVYPFTHSKLLETIISLYLIWSIEGNEAQSFLRYLTFLVIDIIKSTMVNKYFSNKNNNDVFSTFYKDKIDELVNTEQVLIQSFITNINQLTNDKLVSFLVAYYKLFVYIKNKFNREIKTFSFDFYHNKVYNTTFLDVTTCMPIHL